MKKPYNNIITHYEECLEKHGDTHLGVDWPKIEDVVVGTLQLSIQIHAE